MKRAFTLIELLIVIIIISVLSAIAVPQYQSYVDKAKWTEVVNILGALRQACEEYYAETGDYPHISGEHVYLNGPMAYPANPTAPNPNFAVKVPSYPSGTKFIYAIGNKDYVGTPNNPPGAKYGVFGFIDKDGNGEHNTGDPYIATFDKGTFKSDYGAPKFQ